MNIEQLNTYIENKETLDEKSINQILPLIEKYPYFQVAHILLLKSMHQYQPEKYNGQLKISASFISDKKRLYQYIHHEAVDQGKSIEKKEQGKPGKETVLEKNNELKKEGQLVEGKDKRKPEPGLTEKNKTEELSPGPPKDENKPEALVNKSHIPIQKTEVKHKKIVDDFFHFPVKEQPEEKMGMIQETKAKKEFPGKEKIRAILEEKKRNLISRNEPSGIEKKDIDENALNKKVDSIETGFGSDLSGLDTTGLKEKKESISQKAEIDTEPTNLNKTEGLLQKDMVKLQTEEKISTNKTESLENIFSKIRQIKKEINIESSVEVEPIDIHHTDENTKPVLKKTSDAKGHGKVIKESYIGFDESEFKKEEIVGGSVLKTEKASIIRETDLEDEEIKESGLTAKDLFKQHFINKNKEAETTLIQDEQPDPTKSPISKLVETINKKDTISDAKGEKEIVEVENKSMGLVSTPVEEITQTSPDPEIADGESAADLLLKRIANRKRLMEEERKRAEEEKLKPKDEIYVIPEAKNEIEVAEEVIDKDEIPEKEHENLILDDQDGLIQHKEKNPQHLIDSFIKKVETLERIGKKESSLVGDISGKSTEENDEFLTETLADLLIQQKNYAKAIEIYNKLILKFPEKKTYFAIQIKKTESLIK
jgi:hypothetical protein